MKNLFHSGKFLLIDMASTLFFLALFMLTHSIAVSVACGIALGVAQIVWELARRRPIDTMQWVSLIIVVASGSTTLLTHDPRFVMIKLSVIYLFVALSMLKRGWMDRYLPADAIAYVPDYAIAFGYIWAGLMLVSAAVNLIVAMRFGIVFWASFMSIYGIASKLALFLIQFSLMRFVGGQRARAQQAAAA